MGDLIDTTQMYLRTIFELEEEGVVPLRARIAQRLGQSGPTVSQTVARMQRDGLLTLAGDRHLELTEAGRREAVRVMRKHRLAERLLVDVIGLPWALVHDEACRWEHVMSEVVERRLLEVLDAPVESPYGNPIPGLAELAGVGTDRATSSADAQHPDRAFRTGLVRLRDLLGAAPGAGLSVDGVQVRIRRLGEPIQSDIDLLAALDSAGARPGALVEVWADPAGACIGSGDRRVVLTLEDCGHVFVAQA